MNEAGTIIIPKWQRHREVKLVAQPRSHIKWQSRNSKPGSPAAHANSPPSHTALCCPLTRCLDTHLEGQAWGQGTGKAPQEMTCILHLETRSRPGHKGEEKRNQPGTLTYKGAMTESCGTGPQRGWSAGFPTEWTQEWEIYTEYWM